MPRPRRILSRLALLALCGAAGCASLLDGKGGGDGLPYETVRADPGADTAAAKAANEAALEKIACGDLEGAEKKLKAALAADVRYGPAHNNLGHLHYVAGRLYEAAWEFEYAARLMPGDPGPHNNLGLVMEAAGRLPEAIDAYSTASSMRPDVADFLANLARARDAAMEPNHETAAMLRELVLLDSRPQWRAWAGELLATRYQDFAGVFAAGPLPPGAVPFEGPPPPAADVATPPGDDAPPRLLPAPAPLPLPSLSDENPAAGPFERSPSEPRLLPPAPLFDPDAPADAADPSETALPSETAPPSEPAPPAGVIDPFADLPSLPTQSPE
ncbi:hypothetical protein [Alienimonas sp. DA493]|uniref:hypothetical protein n=1 Tax=Alienimonas sp. DA493 TaxID=3373605 RepID=UPI00375445C1